MQERTPHLIIILLSIGHIKTELAGEMFLTTPFIIMMFTLNIQEKIKIGILLREKNAKKCHLVNKSQDDT